MTHKICIVEDHDWLRDIYTQYLSQQPDLVVSQTFSSAEECLQHLSTETDLILVDVSLKAMSGLELIGVIQERWPHIPCIVLSGQSALEMAPKVKELGAVDYVDKGDTSRLLAAVYDVVKQPAQSGEGDNNE